MTATASTGSGGVTRRRLLRAGGGLAAVGLGAAGLKLPFFSADGAQQDPMDCMAGDLSSTDKRLVVSNWTGYIDPRRKKTSTLQEFQRRTGIAVEYTDDINDNAEFYAKVRNQLGDCQPIGRDMIMLTDWMAARMISLGWIQPLDAERVPNLHANLIEPLRNRPWDPDLTYHAPWQSGLTGIAYNAAEVGEVRSFSELLTRADLKGRVTLLTEMRDTMGFLLLTRGADPGDFTPDEWADAIDELRRVVADGQIRAFSGNDYLNDLASGNVLACEAWSGDVIQATLDNPDIRWVVPEEGLMLWSDNMMVPNLATHGANAEAWIDYFYEPEVAARLAAWVNYICPVQGAREAMEGIDPSLVDNPLIFPDDDALAATYGFMALDDRASLTYERDWADVTGG
ncbi:spermidine/putrescine ABC transporter substrate-binding protein [Nocardioides sp. R-C-SC26]|uniref:polyamine ABC transporter substrate-binding protein n=1 Tax=Nocardioides sp. R-C-SC26 TaxID=2870414 RepID=UPI001E2C03F9|nr:spermidine/putrescine ABC transporter substrate-binding protein [Nocardioides sp. R-C-SC26]